MGYGVGSINLNMSGLNKYLNTVGIKDSNICDCRTNEIEDPPHFFWRCPRYGAPRRKMIPNLTNSGIIQNIMNLLTDPYHEITDLVLHGLHEKSDFENRKIFESVEKYIIATSRFNYSQ
jgi:hypothetical protein